MATARDADAGAALAQPSKPVTIGSLTVPVMPRFEGITNDIRARDVMVRLTGTGGDPEPRPASHQRPLQTRAAPLR